MTAYQFAEKYGVDICKDLLLTTGSIIYLLGTGLSAEEADVEREVFDKMIDGAETILDIAGLMAIKFTADDIVLFDAEIVSQTLSHGDPEDARSWM